MTLREIADKIGIGEYPEGMEQVYADLTDTDVPACDLELIDRLQQEHALFDDYYDAVREAAQQVNADKERSKWVKAASTFVLKTDPVTASNVPVPAFDGTLKTAMLPLFVLLPSIPVAIDEYRRRGFSEEELAHLLSTYHKDLGVLKKETGIPGLNRLYFRWLMHYTKCRIFATGGLNFEIRSMPSCVAYIRNKETREVLPLVTGYRYDATGTQLSGIAGYEDETDSFDVTFHEDANAFYGHAVRQCIVSREYATFPKSSWECICRPGDQCLGMHIPKQTDITSEAVMRAVASARMILKERYPEFACCGVFCSSWLLAPILGKILGPESRITKFQEMYVRYPQGGGGKAGFVRTFGVQTDDYASLPENTRLQRGLKQHYMNGGHVFGYAGLIVLND